MLSEKQVTEEAFAREFVFTKNDFEEVRALLKAKTGISLSDRKTNMMYSRLSKRLRALRLTSFSDYLGFLKSPEGADELGFLINAMTTNLTRFYREGHQFDHLMETGLPDALERRRNRGEKRLRLWSAGCSSGQEPYTIAASLMAAKSNFAGWDVKILATDLDTDMLEKGRAGIYDMDALEGTPPLLKAAMKTAGSRRVKGDSIQMGPDLKRMIHFKQLNFLNSWPMKQSFDVIFCRNVMIYFDDDLKRSICRKMVDLLVPGGLFYIGHSESLLNMNLPVQIVGSSIYRKHSNDA